MAYTSPAGTKFYLTTTFASAKTATSMSNANPCSVDVSGSHGYSTNNEVMVTSPWEEITNMIVRVTSVDTDTFTLQGVNTSNTTLFVAAGGVGTTFQLASSWVEIPQVLTVGSSGGDMRTIQVNPIARRNGIVLPDGFNAVQMNFTIGHDVSLSNWATLQDISRTQTLCGFKMVKPNGAATYAYGYFMLSESVTQQQGQADSVAASFFAQGRPISYA